MKIIKYLLRKFIFPSYVIISAIISIVFTVILKSGYDTFFKMTSIILCLLTILRISDDIFDYEDDSKSKMQYLNKKELTVFAYITTIIFLMLNTVFFGIKGILSIATILWIPVQEKFPIIKIAYMPLLFLFYFFVNGFLNKSIIITLVFCFIISTIYYNYKKKG